MWQVLRLWLIERLGALPPEECKRQILAAIENTTERAAEGFSETVKLLKSETLAVAEATHVCCEDSLYRRLSPIIRDAAERACQKVAEDPLLKNDGFSNLGRNLLRDEACEWAKLYLKEQNSGYSDSDVHLACELVYRASRKAV